MVAARLGFEKAMVGTWRATPHPDCMDRLRKHYSHLAEGCFLARKAARSRSGCMATDSDHSQHSQGAVHMVDARLGFEKAMGGTGRRIFI